MDLEKVSRLTRHGLSLSATMVRDVHRAGTPGAEEEIAEPGAEDDGDAQPNVVGHEDEHKPVADGELKHVQH